MSDGPTLKLYIKPGCPWCMQAITWLDEKGYRYKVIDVIADDNAFEEMKLISGQSLAPTLLVEEEDSGGETSLDFGASGASESSVERLVLPDFGVEELRDFLAEHALGPKGR